MPRKGPAPKRPLVVDPVYSSPLVTQLVNKILLDGKKSIAEGIVYGALEGCRDKTGTDPVATLKRALDNAPMPDAAPSGPLAFGRIRRALLGPTRRPDAILASHDPDGHLFVVSRSQISAPRQQTRG